MAFDQETVPGPTCWLPADLVARAPDTNHHSRCPRAHDITLVPLARLRTLQDRIVDRPA